MNGQQSEKVFLSTSTTIANRPPKSNESHAKSLRKSIRSFVAATIAFSTIALPALSMSTVYGQTTDAPAEPTAPTTAATQAPSATAPAASAPIVNADLVDLINKVQSQLDPEKFPSIEAARARVDAAVKRLEGFLSTSNEHGANWLAFLKWDSFKKELEKPTPSFEALIQIEKNFRQNYQGLEMSQFADVRNELVGYIKALRYGVNKPFTITIMKDRLNKMAAHVQAPEMTINSESLRDIGETLEYLYEANQSPELVQNIKNRFSHSNVRVLVSSEFVSRKLTRPVNESNPVNEVILGTQIYGQSHVNGVVTPTLLPNTSQATVRLNMAGEFCSDNIGYNRSVKLYSQGSGTVAACETLMLTNDGLVSLQDTGSDANLFTQINNIEANLKTIQKIATKQAAKKKPEADAIAEGRLVNRVRNQFHEQLQSQISEANVRLRNPQIPAVSRLGLTMPTRSSWSSDNYLALMWKLGTYTQLTAPSSCPLVVSPVGVSVQLHQSAIPNLIDPILAGRVLKNTETGQLVSQFGELSKGIVKEDPNEEPWSITMNAFHPIEIDFDNGLVTFRIRTTRLDKGDQALPHSATIEATYQIVVADNAIQLNRQGDVRVEFSERNQRGSRAVTLRGFLRRKFEEVFKAELLDKPFRPFDKLPQELAGLQLTSITMDDGWIQLNAQ